MHCKVLILVLMDNQNTSYTLEGCDSNGVLILVLMDNQNTIDYHSFPFQKTAVLILVLMDNQNTEDDHFAYKFGVQS